MNAWQTAARAEMRVKDFDARVRELTGGPLASHSLTRSCL